MHTWIRTILDNQALFDDFINWAESIEKTIALKIAKESKTGDLVVIQNLAAELSVYVKIREKFQSESREEKAVVQFKDKP